MRTLDQLRGRDDTTREERLRLVAFYTRLGRLTVDMPRLEPAAVMSRAVQAAKTWRSDLAWRLWHAVGLR